MSCVNDGCICQHCILLLTCHTPFLPPLYPLSLHSFLRPLLSGKRTVRVKEVPLAASSLTQGDVYILDAALKIYIFNGPTANIFEKNKGMRSGDASVCWLRREGH